MPTNFLAGLSALKTGTDLLRVLRDAAKSGELKPDEFASRVGEIYDYIVDSKDALVDAKDEIQELKTRIQALENHQQIDGELKHDGYVYWRDHPDGKRTGPYCVYCWTRDGTLVPMTHISGTFGGTKPSRRFDCAIHETVLVPTGEPVPESPPSVRRRPYGR
ncbi:MAG TPA: hypothetical protein VGN17_04040 [Bryobacteraceae bacterium]|jgi:hypothetical protein